MRSLLGPRKMKKQFLGTHGHIAVQTADINRVVAYFEAMGEEIDHSTEVRDEAGKLIAVYFKKEIGGFAVHLRSK